CVLPVPSASSLLLFFFNTTSPTVTYTLSLHDALPISAKFAHDGSEKTPPRPHHDEPVYPESAAQVWQQHSRIPQLTIAKLHWLRSEEHTSELQSRENLVCRLLLEKKKI